MKNIFLSVIVPCYNEEENIKRDVLRRIFEYIRHKDFSWEVIVSDDGSTDESLALVKKRIENLENFKVLENPHGGKPSALNYGIKAAKGENVLFCDMDQSTPIEELDKLLPYVKEGYAAIIGSRGMDRENFPVYRKIGAFVFASFRKLFLLRDINDTQCGFKLFERRVLVKTFPNLEFFRKENKAKGWTVTSFDVELLHLIEEVGGKIMEVKVVWKDEDTSVSKGGAKQKYIKESIDMFKQILRVKLNDMKGMYSNL